MNELLALYKEQTDYDKADPLFCNAVEAAASNSVTLTHTH